MFEHALRAHTHFPRHPRLVRASFCMYSRLGSIIAINSHCFCMISDGLLSCLPLRHRRYPMHSINSQDVQRVACWVQCVARGNGDLSKSKQKRKETRGGKTIQFAIIGTGSRDWIEGLVPKDRDLGPRGPQPRSRSALFHLYNGRWRLSQTLRIILNLKILFIFLGKKWMVFTRQDGNYTTVLHNVYNTKPCLQKS